MRWPDVNLVKLVFPWQGAKSNVLFPDSRQQPLAEAVI